jgi:hypothetical protein
VQQGMVELYKDDINKPSPDKIPIKEKFWFPGAHQWTTGEPIRKVCLFCGKEKCKCGGCKDIDFYEIVSNSDQAPQCQHCVCSEIGDQKIDDAYNDLMIEQSWKKVEQKKAARQMKGGRKKKKESKK